MNLGRQERDAIVSYRIERSKAALREASDNCGLQHWNLVANRLYYSAYYACSALLIANGISATTHAGVNRMINLHFVKSNIISKSDARLLLDLFNMRQTGDYDDIFDWTEEDIVPLLPDVESFVSKIIALINI